MFVAIELMDGTDLMKRLTVNDEPHDGTCLTLVCLRRPLISCEAGVLQSVMKKEAVNSRGAISLPKRKLSLETVPLFVVQINETGQWLLAPGPILFRYHSNVT